MDKRIGVFIGEVAQEYQKKIMTRIADKATGLGYDVVFICIYGSYRDGIMYADGEKSCVYLPDLTTFDGIIITEDVIDITKIPDLLYKEVMDKATCPVVYLRTKREGCYSVLIDNTDAMRTMTRHFIEHHGFTDICYLSGKKNSNDSIERLAGFMEEMKAHNIPATEHMVYHGDFWKRESKNALDWFMEGRDTFPQVIICANDYMAVSIGDELKKMGAKIPEDTCLSGVDNVIDSKIYNPRLTTLEVDFDKIADEAISIIDDVYNGKFVELEHRVPARLHLRASCGCDKDVYKTSVHDIVTLKNKTYSDTRDLLLMITDYQECIDIDDYMKIANKHMSFMKSKKAYLVRSDQESSIYKNVETESLYTDNVILEAILYKDAPIEFCNIKYPRKKLIPCEFWNKDKPTVLCVFGLHFKSKVYGYMVSLLPEDENNWFDVFTQGYLISISNSIERYESNIQLQDLETIKSVYHKDSLTGILNRRGYDKAIQEKYAKFVDDGLPIAIVSVDMDNLKVINDTFGHSQGDIALATVAKALSMSINDGEYCARIGGDEFAVILDVSYNNRCDKFKADLRQTLEILSDDIDDYDVGVSIGFCRSDESIATSLVACIQLADKRMYADKQVHKKGRV